MGMIQVKRIYEEKQDSDGYRILVDRIWPRGISKEKANLYRWAKEIAPSTELRRWYGHETERFEKFAEEYERELEQNENAGEFVRECCQLMKYRNITFLFSSTSVDENNAIVLAKWIEKKRR